MQNKLILKTLAAGLFLLLIFTGCGKKTEPVNVEQSIVPSKVTIDIPNTLK